tara:strand:+ start:3433 stop:5007 length:1575 start_codon:yes stop_codon:yes gene_type:complete
LNKYLFDKGAYIIRLPYFFYLLFILILFTTTLYFLSNIKDFNDFKFSFYLQTIKFTFIQAFLACLISSMIGFLFSLVFYYSNRDQRIISSFLNFCFILPVIFISFGSIYFYSSNGILSSLLGLLSIEYDMKIFSLTGIIYVTSYFNIAFNANFFYRKLINIPDNYIRVLRSNGIPFLKSLRLQLKNFVFSGYSSVLILTFVFCIGNFTIVYLLSGSPKLTTIELAIYQSIVFEADLKMAILLGLTQLIIILLISISIITKSSSFDTFSSFRNSYLNLDKFFLNDLIFFLIIAYFLIPFIVLIKGLISFNLELLISISFLKSLLNSLSVSSLSTIISILLSLSSLFVYRHFLEKDLSFHKFIFLSISILLFIPSLSLSAMVFYLNFQMDFMINSLWIVSIINSLFITPIMFIFLSGKFIENYKYESNNIALFNISSFNRLIRIDLPKIKYELILIGTTLFVLSLGDLTSVTIFNNSSFKTVPLFISQLYSSYRYDDAFFILSIFILLIFLIIYLPTKLLKKDVKS